MNQFVNVPRFRDRLRRFGATSDARSRGLALYSAAIALADTDTLDVAVNLGRRHGLGRPDFYEIVLQSYLFLGFPRMLEAADHLNRHLPAAQNSGHLQPVTNTESREWFDNGLTLCKRVYGQNYDRLKSRVEAFAPEVFRWMVVEGYGKVLSRPGLDAVDRELAVVACLIIEDRERQLFSHMRGALNVGTAPSLLQQVVADVGPDAGSGYETAENILTRLAIP